MTAKARAESQLVHDSPAFFGRDLNSDPPPALQTKVPGFPTFGRTTSDKSALKKVWRVKNGFGAGPACFRAPLTHQPHQEILTFHGQKGDV